jgi:hypothetical protein
MPKGRKSRSALQPDKQYPLRTVAPKKTTKPRQRLSYDELTPDNPARNPTVVFARPPTPTTPLDNAS